MIASCESGSVVGLACRDEKRVHLGTSVYATESLRRFRQLPKPVSRSSSAFSNSVCSSSSSGRTLTLSTPNVKEIVIGLRLLLKKVA